MRFTLETLLSVRQVNRNGNGGVAIGRCPASAVPNHQGNISSPTRSRSRPTTSLFTRGHRDDQCGISSCLGSVRPKPARGLSGGSGTRQGSIPQPRRLARFRPRLRRPAKVMPAAQAPSKVAPAPYAPSKVSPAPQAPSKIAPAPYAPSKVAPHGHRPRARLLRRLMRLARFRRPRRLRARSLRRPTRRQGFAGPAGPEQDCSGTLRSGQGLAGPAGSGQGCSGALRPGQGLAGAAGPGQVAPAPYAPARFRRRRRLRARLRRRLMLRQGPARPRPGSCARSGPDRTGGSLWPVRRPASPEQGFRPVLIASRRAADRFAAILRRSSHAICLETDQAAALSRWRDAAVVVSKVFNSFACIGIAKVTIGQGGQRCPPAGRRERP